MRSIKGSIVQVKIVSFRPLTLESSSSVEIVKDRALNPCIKAFQKYHFLYKFIKFDKKVLDKGLFYMVTFLSN